MLRIVECGCCLRYHRADYWGDCRNDDESFDSENEAMERFGLASIEVERHEYDEGGNVVEHYVESWPGGRTVDVLPID